MSYIPIGFGAGLRGEEVPLILRVGMLPFWEKTQRGLDPYIMVTLYGRFKGKTEDRWYCLPILDHTCSNIPH